MLKKEPLNHIAWSNKGVALGQLDRSEEALVCHDRAIEIDPNNERAWNYKGAELNSKGRQVEALACYQHALEINLNDAKSWYDNGGRYRARESGRSDRVLESCIRDKHMTTRHGLTKDSVERAAAI